ncbi:hypothetical protein BJV82DRAFT_591635 [Fennellomyces sp. T-0311]|nr:hypothetical protein BJV82DRAFT_591635 [Fennellomyces sp. T-0311]
MSRYISVRIVNIDHYLAEPGPMDRGYCPFSSTLLKKVPVIRIFGSTPSGQKACVHIHQIYPYFYVPYKLPMHNVEPEQIQREIFQFGNALNRAVALSQTNQSGSVNGDQYIAAITLVKGIPFYGYHTKPQTYLKIHLLNPADKQRMADILLSGAVNDRTFQPHEQHIPFELQFMMDYNLYGMNWAHFHPSSDDVQLGLRFREPLFDEPKTVLLSQATSDHDASVYLNETEYFTAMTIPKFMQWSQVGRSSYCELEIDTTAMTIGNRLDLKERDINTHSNEQLIKSLAEIWKDEQNRRCARHESMPSIDTQDEQRDIPKEWASEPALRQTMERFMATEDDLDMSNDNELIYSSTIPTTFEAVESLYPREYYTLHQRPELTQSLIIPPRTLSNLSALLQSEESNSQFSDLGTQERQMANGSPYSIQSATPSRYQDLQTVAENDANVNTALIHSLVHAGSFQDDDDIPDDELLAAAEQFSQERMREEEELSWPSDISPTGPLQADISYEEEEPSQIFRPRRLDFHAEVARMEEREMEQRSNPTADDGELQVSDIPPTTPRAFKRNRYLPQYDGAGDSSEEEEPKPAKTMRRQPPIPEEPRVSIKYFPQLTELVLRKRREAEEKRHTSTKQIPSTVEYTYSQPPPAVSKPGYTRYQEPYYSNPSDVPSKPKVFSGKEFRLTSKSVRFLKPVESTYFHKPDEWEKSTMTEWEFASRPPSPAQIRQWLLDQKQKPTGDEDVPMEVDQATVSQLDGPSTLDFQYSLSKPKSKVTHVRDYLDTLSVEIHVNTRDDMLPDPAHDAVQIIFCCLKTEDANIVSNGFQDGYHVEIIAVGTDIDTQKIGLPGIETTYVDDEEGLFKAFIEIIRLYDPDLLVGYELHNASWGYLIERATVHGINMMDELSRVGSITDHIQHDRWGYRKASIFRITGRHMINVWRIMQGEYNLTSYTFENVAHNILHCRVPHFSYRTLTSWHTQGEAVLKYRLYRYYLDRVQMNHDILDTSGMIDRTCESARVFGIDFYSVLTRGSQFKVESMMFRIAKPENFVMITPNRHQVGKQRAAECLPLVMEPETQFYNSPVLVLDFQSLYPSVMIAYNYCYSTCLGKVRSPGDSTQLGVTNLDISPAELVQLKDQINVSPNGVMFVKPSVRKSLLAKMLDEILSTRVMIKKSMKDYKDDSGLLRLLDARQLTLKYIANVTYGYTSASFSGRMPAVEIADSIVQTGRETLERTIAFINQTEKWDARVVYGDTDSVFVSLSGRTREEAFQIGKEIAEAVTKRNPSPIRLKFEKVYQPCVLVAKKRYVGFKYESPEQVEPEFEAKGIETVRRDGTMATQKILEASLKILFRTQDMSELKEYLYRQWTKVLSNRVSMQDFIIAREVRLGTYTEQGMPNGARVAQSKMAIDPRDAPQHGERVPYVVVYRGGPNARLRDKVVRPEEILHDNSLLLDAEYYITKMIIPPLSRIFNLIGVDIKQWYDEMPRSRKAVTLQPVQQSKSRIDQYYASSHCIVCRQLTDQTICTTCQSQPAQTANTLLTRQAETESHLTNVLLLCQSCSGISPILTASTDPRAPIDDTGYADHACDSLDCPVFFERVKAKNDVRATSTYDQLL